MRRKVSGAVANSLHGVTSKRARLGVPVSTRALVQRINRALEKQDQELKVTRGARARQELGEYYVLNVNRNWVVETNVDLEALGRELGVLKPYERYELPEATT